MVTVNATAAPTAVIPAIVAGAVPWAPARKCAIPAHSTRKYDPGGPTRSARQTPAVVIASRTAVTAKAGVEPAVKAPSAVETINASPTPSTVANRRRIGAAGAYRTANVPVTHSSPRSWRPASVPAPRHSNTVSAALTAGRSRGGLGARVTS